MSRPPPPRQLHHPGWVPSARAGLERLLSGPPGVAVFDCDRTLIHGDISETALADLEADTGASLVAAYEEGVRRDKLTAYVELVHVLVAGKTESEARALAERTLRRHNSLRPREALRELVWALHRCEWEVWVVSASPEVLVQVVTAQFGIHPHRVIGMRSHVDDAGRFRSELVPPATWREGKVAALHHLPAPPDLAVGDSEGDLPMMRAARTSLLIDLDTEDVVEEARRIGAWIQPGADLTEPGP
jgi:HAD superfamily phosphoserine phosphatase-like hydrolase